MTISNRYLFRYFRNMKKVILILIVINYISCSSTKKADHKESKIKSTSTEYGVTTNYAIVNKDTISFNELRFYKINSALDSMKSMYIEYGTWNNISNGLHQENITRKIWKNIKLFENDEKFTIIADGKESINEYFTSLIVFDSNGNDCFEENHPLKDKIVELFSQKIKKNKNKRLNTIKF